MKRLGILVLVVLVAGCGKSEKTAAPQPAPSPSPDMQSLQQLPSIRPPTSPDEVLVRIGDTTLTRREAEQEAMLRLSAVQDQIPPGQESAIQERMLGTVIEQFMVRTLLLKEADRRGIEITEEDKEQAYAKIEEALEKEGKTLEEAIQNSPLGEERMRQEVNVGIRIDKLLAQVTADLQDPSQEEIEAFIEENRDRLVRPELVHARHILLTADDSMPEEEKQAKREQAEQIRQELLDGADFAELARAKSEGPSNSRGGDLGQFPRGRMVPPFDEAAFSQEVDAIGPIVETQFGYHIIQVLEHTEAGQPDRDEIVEIMKQQAHGQALRSLVESLIASEDIDFAPSVEPFLPPALKGR